MRFSGRHLSLPFVLSLLASCAGGRPPLTPDGQWQGSFDAVSRADFNRVAVELDVPLFWADDTNKDKALDPSELAVLWRSRDGAKEEDAWISGGTFTPAFRIAYANIERQAREGARFEGLSADEAARRKLVLKELDLGKPTLVLSDFRNASAEDKAIVEHVLAAARIVERIYQKQVGIVPLAAKIPADDPASRALFDRNQSPRCETPVLKADPNCKAIPEPLTLTSGLYPADLLAKPNFCDLLAARPDARALMNEFVVVRGEGDDLKPVPYHRAFENDMQAAAKELDLAADAITSADEGPFQTYLRAAAKAFRDGSYFDADEAWTRMNTDNSKWYLRAAPDETYFEPCGQKAGFHVSFARIDPGSIPWKEKLDPLKQEMEQKLADLAGPPYTAQKVAFHLPDFISVILNAGDSRSPHGATTGQSLPNFGPVANESRGRTVVMTNFYTDQDSVTMQRAQASALFCADTMPMYTDDPSPQLMSTVLHEAAHNLGPAHEYAVNGKKDSEIFGGPLANMLEELKAQSAALFFSSWLAQKGAIGDEKARQAHVRDIVWAFGHISLGMYDSEKKPQAYSQLSAIQVGYLLDQGALVYRAGEKAANGTDQGCLSMKADAMPGATQKLLGVVAKIKGSGDKAGAEALVAKYVDAPGAFADLRKTMAERWQRQPKQSFVYSIRR